MSNDQWNFLVQQTIDRSRIMAMSSSGRPPSLKAFSIAASNAGLDVNNAVRVPLVPGGGAGTPADAPQLPCPPPCPPVASSYVLPKIMRPSGHQKSPFWKYVKLLDEDDPRRPLNPKATHYCTFCNKLIRSTWTAAKLKPTSGSYTSSPAQRHLERCEKGGREVLQNDPGIALNEMKKRKAMMDVLLGKSKNVYKNENKKMKISPFKLPIYDAISNTPSTGTATYDDIVYSHQAHFFIYSAASQSFDLFRDPEFYMMMMAPQMHPSRTDLPPPATITLRHVKLMVDAEWNLLRKYIRITFKKHFEQASGNPFCQLLHHECTLEDKRKYQAFGLQFTDCEFKCNHVIGLAFYRVMHSRPQYVANLAKELILEVTGLTLEEVIGSSIEDVTAKKVASKTSAQLEALEAEVESSDIHMNDGDKVGLSAIGKLTRKDGAGNDVDPFKEGKTLMDKLGDQAELFTNSILSNLNQTSPHDLLLSSIRANQELCFFYSENRLEPKLTDKDWKQCREMEGILNLSKNLCTLANNGSKMNAAYEPVVRKQLHDALSADTIALIDINNWDYDDSTRAPRVATSVATFSDVGKTCLRRALLETERTFFNNTGESTFKALGEKVNFKLSKRELARLVLDKRTFAQKGILSRTQWSEAIKALEVFYVDFYANCKAFERKKERERCGKIRASATCNLAEPEPTTDSTTIDDAEGMFDMFGDCDEGDTGLNDYGNDNKLVESGDSGASEKDQDQDEEKFRKVDEVDGRKEYNNVIKEWNKWKAPWRERYPNVQFPQQAALDPFDDLMNLDMKPMMDKIEKHNRENDNVFGYLPLICKSSPCQLGAVSALRFVERVNSCANLVKSKRRSGLDDKLLHKIVVLRMCKNFIQFMRMDGRDDSKVITGFTALGRVV